MTDERARLRDLDIGKGIAITLVVLGHLVAREARPDGSGWFLPFQIALYSFHMAFFFYLAGYVFWTARPGDRARRVRRAAARMLPAYLLMAVSGYVAKRSMVTLAPVGKRASADVQSWLTLVMYPTEGFVAYLWFIVALLSIYVLTLAALRLLAGSTRPFVWLTALALALHALSVTDHVTSVGALHYTLVNWVFFVLAWWTWRDRALVAPRLRRWWPVLLAALVAALFVVRGPLQWTVPALIALPALHGLSLAIASRPGRLAGALTWLGERSWPIYLFNTFAIGLANTAIVKTVGLNDTLFVVAIVPLMAAGLLLPILVQSQVLSRVRWIDRITR